MFEGASAFNQDLCDWNDHLGSEIDFSSTFDNTACYGGATVSTNSDPLRYTPLCGLCGPFQEFFDREELRGVLNIGEADPLFGG